MESYFSFWQKTFQKDYDCLIVGSGIMGLSVALEYKIRFPEASVLVMESGAFPDGASVRNAGFACFGSITEIAADIEKNGYTATLALIEKRWKGIQLLRQYLGDDRIGYENFGGHELLFDKSESKLDFINEMLFPVFERQVFYRKNEWITQYGFRGVEELLFTPLEGQIDSGKMIDHYIRLLREKNVEFHFNTTATAIADNQVATAKCVYTARQHIFVCTNALLPTLARVAVLPGRGQVIITAPLQGLRFKGTFHFDEGYYYFRNVGNAVLFGGGRNKDFYTETTTDLAENSSITDHLHSLLQQHILSEESYKTALKWQGIMGFTEDKLPLIYTINSYATALTACNGMGVALSPAIAQEVVRGL